LLFDRHLMQTLLDHIPDIICFKDRDAHFVRVSRSLEQLTHTTPGSLVGKNYFDIVDQPYAEQKQADDLEVINFAKNIIGKEELSIISGHDERWISTTKLPWYDERGNTIGLFSISRDITAVTARTGTMHIIEEWGQRFDSKVNTPEERQGKVAYFIPIKQGKRVLAVLGTGGQIEDKERTLQQIDTMAPLWEQVAIALDHAQLY
jgi:PAS domain S-box-containing protein